MSRYREAGVAGLVDRSSAPRHVANRTPEDRIEAIVKLRQLRFTAAEIAETLSMALSTASGILPAVFEHLAMKPRPALDLEGCGLILFLTAQLESGVCVCPGGRVEGEAPRRGS